MFQLVTSPRRFKVNTLCDELATIQTTQKHKDPSLQKKTDCIQHRNFRNKLFKKPRKGGSTTGPNKLNRNAKSKQHRKSEKTAETIF